MILLRIYHPRLNLSKVGGGELYLRGRGRGHGRGQVHSHYDLIHVRVIIYGISRDPVQGRAQGQIQGRGIDMYLHLLRDDDGEWMTMREGPLLHVHTHLQVAGGLAGAGAGVEAALMKREMMDWLPLVKEMNGLLGGENIVGRSTDALTPQLQFHPILIRHHLSL